jgi:hypothetical protein
LENKIKALRIKIGNEARKRASCPDGQTTQNGQSLQIYRRGSKIGLF